MKKYILAVSCFFTSISIIHAQANSVSTTGKWGSQIFISDVNGRAFENKYADVNGSPYLFPNFKFASIVLSDGRKYSNVSARLNLVEHEINFIAIKLISCSTRFNLALTLEYFLPSDNTMLANLKLGNK